MKKLYLFALMAGATIGLNAQTGTTIVSGNTQKGLIIQPKVTEAKPAVNGPLRAAGSASLPDSIVYVDANGVNLSRNAYEYDENGQVTTMRAYDWDAATNDWSTEKRAYNTYQYDENGNEIYHTFEGWNGNEFDSQVTNNVYDEQNRLIHRDFVGQDNHAVTTYTYDGNQCVYSKVDSVFSENMNYLSFEIYTLDEAGRHLKDSIFSFEEVNEAGQPKWYLNQAIDYTYDSQGREIAATTNYYSTTGYIGKNERTTTYPGDGTEEYTMIQQITLADGSLGQYRADKCEIEAGNPEKYIYYAKNNEAEEWALAQTIYKYYPQGTVANETIERDAAPAITAYAANGTLHVNTTAAQRVQVYNVSGACLYDATANGHIAITRLPAGIYIVKAADETIKLSVR